MSNVKREMTCVVCPKGCQLQIKILDDGTIKVTGNECIRGEKYAIQEIKDPRRNISSTVRVRNGEQVLLPVKTDKEISKEIIFEVMEKINNTQVEAPIKISQIILKDVDGEGSNIVACRSIEKNSDD